MPRSRAPGPGPLGDFCHLSPSRSPSRCQPCQVLARTGDTKPLLLPAPGKGRPGEQGDAHQSAFLLAASKHCGASLRFLFSAQARHLYFSSNLWIIGQTVRPGTGKLGTSHPDASAPCQLSQQGHEDAPGRAGSRCRRWAVLMQSPLSSAVTRSPAAAWKASADVQHCHGSQASPCLTLCPSYNLEASSAQSKPELEKLRASSVGWDGFCSHTINPLKPQRFIPGLAQSHRDCTGLCAAGLPAWGKPGPGRRSQRSPWQAAVTDTSHHPAQHHSGDAASIKRNISTNPAHARASRGSASFRGSVKQHQPAGARLQVGRDKPGAFFFFFLLKKGRTCGRHLFQNSAPVLGGIWPDLADQALLPQHHIRRAVSTQVSPPRPRVAPEDPVLFPRARVQGCHHEALPRDRLLTLCWGGRAPRRDQGMLQEPPRSRDAATLPGPRPPALRGAACAGATGLL